MSTANESLVTLRIYGDDLIPDEITALLGCRPDIAYTKGDVYISKHSDQRYVRKTGRWSLRAARMEPEDVSAQITEILARLPQNLDIWRQLGEKYVLDFFCGVFMGSTNDELYLPLATVKLLSERGIELQFDIYALSTEDADAPAHDR